MTTVVNDDGPDTFKAMIIPKLRLMDGADTYTSNGDTITITTPQLAGTALVNLSGDWFVEKTFTTEADALAYIKSTLNISDQVINPVASIAGGAYTGTQSVTLSTTTAGATIKYTLDGTTPSATVGTTYSTAISITASKMLRFVAYKSGMATSNVISEEYVIS